MKRPGEIPSAMLPLRTAGRAPCPPLPLLLQLRVVLAGVLQQLLGPSVLLLKQMPERVAISEGSFLPLPRPPPGPPLTPQMLPPGCGGKAPQ